jgi:hypothetical protein
VMLLAMLVEEHKEVMRLRSQLETLLAEREKAARDAPSRDQPPYTEA